jgi:hypothetical protein
MLPIDGIVDPRTDSRARQRVEQFGDVHTAYVILKQADKDAPIQGVLFRSGKVCAQAYDCFGGAMRGTDTGLRGFLFHIQVIGKRR